MLCVELYDYYQNRYIEEQIWLRYSEYKTISHELKISALSIGASYFSIRYQIYQKLQDTVEDGVCLHVKGMED